MGDRDMGLALQQLLRVPSGEHAAAALLGCLSPVVALRLLGESHVSALLWRIACQACFAARNVCCNGLHNPRLTAVLRAA